MSATEPIFQVKVFQGIRNLGDQSRTLPVGGKSFLAAGVNVDIDDNGMPHRRDGFATASYAGTNVHSLWGNGETCLFVENPDFKRLNPDFTATTVRSGVGEAKMVYAEAARRVYYTNSQVIGYIEDGLDHALPAVTMTFKIPMPPGHLIEWFNGRLYVAKGKEIWASDPMYPGQTDSRKGFKQFAGRLTLMRAVRETGIFVSDSFQTYLMAGLDFQEFTLVKIADFPAILGTDVKIDGSRVVKGYPGEVLLWLSAKGICVAGKGGLFQVLTQDYYRPKNTAEGVAILRELSDSYQYLISQT